jgi:hypothetical protein
MATTNISELRKVLRGLLSPYESSTADGDATAGVLQNLIDRITRQTVNYRNDYAHATLTAVMPAEIVFQAARACKLSSARYAQSISLTISTSAPFTLTLIKRKSPSYSLTFAMATLTPTTATITNKPLASNAFTLSSLSSEQEMAAGDTVTFKHTGVHGLLPRGLLTMEIVSLAQSGRGDRSRFVRGERRERAHDGAGCWLHGQRPGHGRLHHHPE